MLKLLSLDNKKVRILSLMLMLSPFSVCAQFVLSATSGYGSFAMSDMKKLQASIINDFPVTGKITASFPSFWFFEASGIVRSETNLVVGGAVGYTSTGGRVSYSDYSGMLGVDQLLNSYSFSGIFGTVIKSGNPDFIITGALRPGVIFTELEIVYDQAMGGQHESNSYEFHSVNLSLQPTATITWKFGWCALHALGGYQVNVGSKLYLKGNRDAYLTDDNDDPIKADWTGFRVGAGISFFLTGLQ